MRKTLFVIVVIISTIVLLPFVFVFIPFLIILAPIVIAALLDLGRDIATPIQEHTETIQQDNECW